MKIDIQEKGAFGSALVILAPGETFMSEAGAMYRASANVEIDVTTRTRGKGGLLAGLKRLVAGDSFFLSTYRTTDGRPGEVGLAPTLQGEVRAVKVTTGTPWVCSGGSYLGSSDGLELDTQYQGLLKGGFNREGLFFLRVAGRGTLLVNAYGRLTELEVRDALTVDNGHIVAYTETLQYTIGKAGKGLVSSWLSGEGLVMKFTGSGRILVQSHDPDRFGARLGGLLPPREA